MEQVLINPMWIYWLYVIDNFKFFINFILALSVVVFVIILINLLTEPELTKFIKKVFIIDMIIFFSFFLIKIFLPTKDVLIGMMVAKTVTVEKVIQGKEVVKGSIDYIFEKIKEVKHEIKN